jgi:hypothetical protein
MVLALRCADVGCGERLGLEFGLFDQQRVAMSINNPG